MFDKLGMVALVCNSTNQVMDAGDQKFRVVLGYIESSRLAWDLGHTRLSKKKRHKMQR